MEMVGQFPADMHDNGHFSMLTNQEKASRREEHVGSDPCGELRVLAGTSSRQTRRHGHSWLEVGKWPPPSLPMQAGRAGRQGRPGQSSAVQSLSADD